MNNSWNRVIYKIGSRIYDKIFNSGIFLRARKHVFESITFNNKDKILFVGIGTGADLKLIKHSNLDITAIDLSPDMLKKAKEKYGNSSIKFMEMDAQQLDFNDGSYDYIVGSLILSVVPEADKCLQEMTRVLKPEGKIIIFDKFISKNEKLSLLKKLLRPLIQVLGTDIGLRFEDLFREHEKRLKVEEDQPIMWNGMYRKIILNKRG
ncbi:class I SAM-dependent methyltransferase [Peribacillus sp. NPDC097295]|uniref:class I SAM-dependent methyltransferase n=1 Tax=Peribacillus sp. NPDC097295 TaxID=3364402 RepID=UPI00381186E3